MLHSRAVSMIKKISIHSPLRAITWLHSCATLLWFIMKCKCTECRSAALKTCCMEILNICENNHTLHTMCLQRRPCNPRWILELLHKKNSDKTGKYYNGATRCLIYARMRAGLCASIDFKYHLFPIECVDSVKCHCLSLSSRCNLVLLFINYSSHTCVVLWYFAIFGHCAYTQWNVDPIYIPQKHEWTAFEQQSPFWFDARKVAFKCRLSAQKLWKFT